jgi:hypothetical protein
MNDDLIYRPPWWVWVTAIIFAVIVGYVWIEVAMPELHELFKSAGGCA